MTDSRRTPEERTLRGAQLQKPVDRPCPKCGKVFGYLPGAFGTHVKHCDNDMGTSFWSKVNKDAPNGCWEWTASRKERGYGQFLWRGKMHRAHRLAWVLSGRKLPAKPLELAHTCHSRTCVNPAHLYPATHQRNMQDCKESLRHQYGERHKKAKLTEAKVLEIRALKGTASHKEIAARYGVSQPTVQSILVGRTWRHL
jgi:hypothetical protein